MNHDLFTIYDRKADAHHAPFTSSNTNTASRSMLDLLNNPEHPFHKHPQDYVLTKIGIFDDETGVVVSFDATQQESLELTLLLESANQRQLF